MSRDEWIDKELSSELPVIRGRGEGQRIEYMESFPTNGHNLTKEIAAFASSNSGMIIIGVADDGTLVGLTGVNSSIERDKLCRRVEALCTSSVKPAITPVIKFGREEGQTVLAIEVPRGKQPIYYNVNTPYIRHHSQSRPAEPHEVIERVAEWLKTSPLAPAQAASPEDTIRSQFLSALADTLVDILIYGNELDDREVNPWLDQLRHQLGFAAETLRKLAAEDTAVEMGLDSQLREIADYLEQAKSHTLVMGRESWAELEDYIAKAVQGARTLKAEQIDTIALSADSVNQLQDVMRSNARRLMDLDERAERMVDEARVEEVQSEASEIGYTLLRVNSYRFDDHTEDFTKKMHAIGRDLHLLETERLYLDGGQSIRRVLERLHQLNERLQELLKTAE